MVVYIRKIVLSGLALLLLAGSPVARSQNNNWYNSVHQGYQRTNDLIARRAAERAALRKARQRKRAGQRMKSRVRQSAHAHRKPTRRPAPRPSR